VLVHGGGPEIDRELAARNIPTVRVDGLRVTDAATLKVTEAALCGTVNKQLVRALLALGVPAVGLSGQDGALLPCHPELVEGSATSLGFVGAVTRVNPGILTALLDAGFLPVVAPLGVAEDGSTAYNVNADTAAGAIAAALHAQTFILVTNVERVRRDPDDAASGIERMTLAEAREFLASDACRQSMKPNIAAAITAAESGATAHICAESQTTLATAKTGTTITPQ
jgi:acetylglutamate kinase